MKSWMPIALLLMASNSPQGLAGGCCGNGGGGGDPVILFPDEAAKLYLGMTRKQDVAEIDAKGDQVRTDSSETMSTNLAEIAGGIAITDRLFTTLYVPYVTNTADGHSESVVGDPSASIRWTLARQEFDAPWRPQVQVMGGVKKAVARSPYTRRQDDGLDVASTGFDEVRAGLDLWYGLQETKFDLSAVVSQPIGRTYDGVAYAPGRIFSGSVMAGYAFLEELTILVGVGRRVQERWLADGQALDLSESTNNSASATVAWDLTTRQSIRLVAARSGAFGAKRNTTSSTDIGAAYLRAF